MYSTKFFWNCPHCKALNSYCPGIKSSISDFQQSKNELFKIQMKCHYCTSISCLYIDENMEIKDILSINKINSREHFICIMEGSFNPGEEKDFIDQNCLVLGDKSSGTYLSFMLNDWYEIRFSVNFYDIMKSTYERFQYSKRSLQIRTRNILEFNAILSTIVKAYKKFKVPFVIKENFIVTPDLFNSNDIIVNISNEESDIAIDYSTHIVGDSTTTDYLFYYAAMLYYDDFGKALKLLAQK